VRHEVSFLPERRAEAERRINKRRAMLSGDALSGIKESPNPDGTVTLYFISYGPKTRRMESERIVA
jgi:hypothetical protein